MTLDWRERLAEFGGVAPPALLRARLIEDADEVLVCSYTADLRFFETTCLPEARAVRARVTVVHDDAQSMVPAGELRHAGTAYADVPVRCKSGGEFHPKLLLIAGQNRVIAAVGSGNATSAGWHHNAELWTVLGAEAADWPQAFADLSAWLAHLPDVLHVDPFGASRILDVANLLSLHKPVVPGPRLVHNLNRSIMSALPDLAESGGVEELGIASPFLDGEGAALTELTRRLAPEKATLSLTSGAVGPVTEVARWANIAGREVRPVAGSRYHHGKLIEWRLGGSYEALVGSANVTAAAMLRTTRMWHGNCELGLLLDTENSLLPVPSDDPLDIAGLGDHMLEPSPRRDDGPAFRLLCILLGDASVMACLAGTETVRTVAQLVTPAESVSMRPGASVPGLITLVADVRVAAGALCSVLLADGTMLGPVRVTDPVGVRLRPGAGSPLEDESLPQVLSHPQLSGRLFEALAELAQVRPESELGSSGRVGSGTTWRAAAERAVGSSLVTMALGRHQVTAPGAAGGEVPSWSEPGPTRSGSAPEDVVSESDEDDVGSWDGDEVDSGIEDQWDVARDPVSLMLADPITARRIARLIERRLADLKEWQPPAVLALLRVSLLVAAGGGWDTEMWIGVVAYILEFLKPADAEELEASRQAACTVGLAALASQIESWDEPSELRTCFEKLRAELTLNASVVDSQLVAHYAVDLHLGLGPQLTLAGVLDAIEFLIDGGPLSRIAEGLADTYPEVRLAAPRLLEIETSGTGRSVVLRLLAQCSEYAPLAVRARARDGILYAAWRPKRLLVQYDGHPARRGYEYQLPIGPGIYATQSFPPPVKSWTGAIPAALQLELVTDGLLDPEPLYGGES